MFDQPLLANQHLGFELAELASEVEVLKYYNYAAAEAASTGQDITRFATVAKLRSGRLAAARGRRVPPVPRRHRVHGGDVDGAVLP